jgi:hypothetical protein
MSDLVRVHLGGGFVDPPQRGGSGSAGQRFVHVPSGDEKRAVFCKGSGIMAGPVFKGMDAYSIHKAFINNYVTAAGRAPPSGAQAHHRTDADILRSTFRCICSAALPPAAPDRSRRFLRSEEEMVGDTWEKRVAIKYYDKLFKEYCLADLSRHKVHRPAAQLLNCSTARLFANF